MKNIKYPSKPWRDGQRATLVNGMEFIYSSSLRNWVPVKPGQESVEQVAQSLSVSDISTKFDEVEDALDSVLSKVAEELATSVKIVKSTTPPANPKANDIWVDADGGKSFSYDAEYETWVES